MDGLALVREQRPDAAEDSDVPPELEELVVELAPPLRLLGVQRLVLLCLDAYTMMTYVTSYNPRESLSVNVWLTESAYSRAFFSNSHGFSDLIG